MGEGPEGTRRARVTLRYLAAAAATAVVGLVAAQAQAGPHAARAQNGRIAFSVAASGHWSIQSILSTGTERVRLAATPGVALSPVWSPDGTQIAYVCENFSICLINADGSGRRALTQTGAWKGSWIYDLDPTWAPDGKRIAFASNRTGNDYDLYVVNVDGTGLRRLSTTANPDAHPVWSPDGTKLAFESSSEGSIFENVDIYTVTIDAPAVTRITSSDRVERAPAWSPDGTKIAFAREDGFGYDVFVMNADGSTRTVLADNQAIEESPAWAPDGSAVAFDTLDRGSWDIAYTDAGGRTRTRVASASSAEIRPSWQPVGVAPLGLPTTGAAPAAATGDAQFVAAFLGWVLELDGAMSEGGSIVSPGTSRLAPLFNRAAKDLGRFKSLSAKGKTVQKLIRSGLTDFAKGIQQLAKIDPSDPNVQNKVEAVFELLRKGAASITKAEASLGFYGF